MSHDLPDWLSLSPPSPVTVARRRSGFQELSWAKLRFRSELRQDECKMREVDENVRTLGAEGHGGHGGHGAWDGLGMGKMMEQGWNKDEDQTWKLSL